MRNSNNSATMDKSFTAPIPMRLPTRLMVFMLPMS
jgi:hypothetical protein